MKRRLTQEEIAERAAREFNDGDYVNLGVGIPNLCASYIPHGMDVISHAEHGVLGYGPLLSQEDWGKGDFDYVDAGLQLFTPKPGMCFFDKALSFDMIWGRHLDITVLGGVEVTGKGDLANWTYGSIESGGIGGSMDLALGAKKVIIVMEHTTKGGAPKIVNKCKFPLTAKECVNLIVSDLAVIEVSSEGLILREVAPEWSVDEVQALTEPRMIIAEDLEVMNFK